jgi:hypothetical protein
MGGHVRNYTSAVRDARLERRTFLRLASLGALGAVAACAEARPAAAPILREVPPTPTVNPSQTPAPTQTPTAASPTPAATVAGLAWRQIKAKGPTARHHHTFTANDAGTIAFMFGGRSNGQPRADLWAFDRSSDAWEHIPVTGPPSRFGHAAAFADGHLVIFGGQGSSGSFLNDAWAFDPVRGAWSKLEPKGGPPAARYGTSGTTIGTALTISHGYATGGGLDDTWALSSGWVNVTPKAGPIPKKRWVHRAVYVPGLGRMLLFGGQAVGSPFLGDTWLYDPATQTWSEVTAPGPPPRLLFALAATKDRAYLFGGQAAVGGPQSDLWSFSSEGWTALQASGPVPPGRIATQGVVVSGPSMLVFGGTDGTHDLGDLWELKLP